MSMGMKMRMTVGGALVMAAAVSYVVGAEITESKPTETVVSDTGQTNSATVITPPTHVNWSTQTNVPLGAPAFDQTPHVDDSTIAKGEKLKKVADRIEALQAIVDDGENNLRTFRQSHGISAIGSQHAMETELLGRMNEKLLDLQIKLAVDQTRLESMKKRAADDKALADFQEAVDEDTAALQVLQKSRDAQARKVQDLDYFLEMYERVAAPTKALEATVLQMKLQLTLDSTAG